MVATGAKAGFWIRTGAYILDAICLGIAGSILNGILRLEPTSSGNGLVNLLIGLVYFVALWSSTGHGQTLGMRVLNLKVIKTDGSELTYSQAAIRYVGLLISFAALAIGVIWVAFDADRQGWHDKIADTYVIKTK
jgi:uncharacterized RDD family membrane protein YckC